MNAPQGATAAPIHVLFLCTHNSARSILAEALLNHLGAARFRAFSAGSRPAANQQPHPLALQVLRQAGISTAGLRSKSWDEFGRPDAPEMDLVVTVCDSAAAETCPFWPGGPAMAHWGYADPSRTEGTEQERLAAFQATMQAIGRRLQVLNELSPDRLQRGQIAQTAAELSAIP